MTYSFSGAAASFENNLLALENNVLRARFAVCGGRLTLLALENKEYALALTSDGTPEEAACAFSTDDLLGEASPHLSARLKWSDGEIPREAQFSLFPSLPFIGIRFFADGAYQKEADPILTCALPSPHVLLKSVTLYDKTDREDMLVTEDVRPLYKNGVHTAFRGNLFFAEDRVSGLTLAMIKDAPTFSSAVKHDGFDLIAEGTKSLTLVGTGADGTAPGRHELYGATVGLGKHMEEAYKSWFRAMYKGEDKLFVMSNTWGDRSQDSAVSESFMMGEIDRAACIGVDIVQIDDGWQKGATANSKVASGGVWEGYYACDPDFWKPNPSRFPRGLAPVAAYAKEKGVELGLWFSPDSSDEFQNHEKDAETILSLWRTYGIRTFKLDGVNLPSKRAETNFLSLLTALVSGSEGKIRFNLDITAQNRLGYLYQKSFGTLFVENRYTDWGNYYPHNTLKNLWCLSRYFPTEKFQFELLNPERNKDKYPNDPFAPYLYDIDYEFASVMLADPLVWMEMTHLSDENTEKLRKIVALWREHREKLRRATVFPIGDMPSGQAFTGFQAVCGKEGYLVLFRESTLSPTAAYSLPRPAGKLTLLASNGEVSARCDRSSLEMTMQKPRTYAFYHYEI